MKKHDVDSASRQEQFLDVIGRDEATLRFQSHLTMRPIGVERVLLSSALGRVLAIDISSGVDVPAFDRANVDGFAIRASDSFEAMEESPRAVAINDEVLAPGVEPQLPVDAGTGTPIA